jgi:hypothetical protein
MSQPIERALRIGQIGMCCGVVMSVLVIAYGYLEPHIHGPAINDWLIVMACPSSIALMASDTLKWPQVVLVDLVVVVTNAAWYGFWFALAAISSRHIMDRIFSSNTRADQ